MLIERISGWQRCTHCRKRRVARFLIEKEPYCKRCHKRFMRGLAKLNKENPKGWKKNRKTVTERVLKLRRRATPAEKCFLEKLKEACPVQFKFQRGFIKHGYYAIVDFHIPSRNLCIEIDGGYHNNPEQQQKDERRDNWLKEVRKQRVIRLTNEAAFKITVDQIRKLIE